MTDQEEMSGTHKSGLSLTMWPPVLTVLQLTTGAQSSTTGWEDIMQLQVSKPKPKAALLNSEEL